MSTVQFTMIASLEATMKRARNGNLRPDSDSDSDPDSDSYSDSESDAESTLPTDPIELAEYMGRRFNNLPDSGLVKIPHYDEICTLHQMAKQQILEEMAIYSVMWDVTGADLMRDWNLQTPHSVELACVIAHCRYVPSFKLPLSLATMVATWNRLVRELSVHAIFNFYCMFGVRFPLTILVYGKFHATPQTLNLCAEVFAQLPRSIMSRFFMAWLLLEGESALPDRSWSKNPRYVQSFLTVFCKRNLPDPPIIPFSIRAWLLWVELLLVDTDLDVDYTCVWSQMPGGEYSPEDMRMVYSMLFKVHLPLDLLIPCLTRIDPESMIEWRRIGWVGHPDLMEMLTDVETLHHALLCDSINYLSGVLQSHQLGQYAPITPASALSLCRRNPRCAALPSIARHLFDISGYVLRPTSCNVKDIVPLPGTAIHKVGGRYVLRNLADPLNDVELWLTLQKYVYEGKEEEEEEGEEVEGEEGGEGGEEEKGEEEEEEEETDQAILFLDPIPKLQVLMDATGERRMHELDQLVSYAMDDWCDEDERFNDVQLLLFHLMVSFQMRSPWKVIGDVGKLHVEPTHVLFDEFYKRPTPPVDENQLLFYTKHIVAVWVEALGYARTRAVMQQKEIPFVEKYLSVHSSLVSVLQASMRRWVVERLRAGSFDTPYITPDEFMLPCRLRVMGAPWSMAHTFMLNAVLQDGTALEEVRWAEMVARAPALEGGYYLALPVVEDVVWWVRKLPEVRRSLAPYFRNKIPSLSDSSSPELHLVEGKDIPWLAQIVRQYYKLKREEEGDGSGVDEESEGEEEEDDEEEEESEEDDEEESNPVDGVQEAKGAEEEEEEGAEEEEDAEDDDTFDTSTLSPVQRQIYEATTTDDFAQISWLDLSMKISPFIPPALTQYSPDVFDANDVFEGVKTLDEMSDADLRKLIYGVECAWRKAPLTYVRPPGYRGVCMFPLYDIRESSPPLHRVPTGPEACPVCCEEITGERTWVSCSKGAHGACSDCTVRHILARDDLIHTCLTPDCRGHHKFNLPFPAYRQLIPILRNMGGRPMREPTEERIQAFTDMGGTYPFHPPTSRVQGGEVKQCPGCSRYVSRIIGCLLMTCECGYRFCWSCMGPAHTHYDCTGDQADRKSRSTLLAEISAQMMEYMADAKYTPSIHADKIAYFLEAPLLPLENPPVRDVYPRRLAYVLTEILPHMSDAQLTQVWQDGASVVAECLQTYR